MQRSFLLLLCFVLARGSESRLLQVCVYRVSKLANGSTFPFPQLTHTIHGKIQGLHVPHIAEIDITSSISKYAEELELLKAEEERYLHVVPHYVHDDSSSERTSNIRRPSSNLRGAWNIK
jgi:hypothetical protein